MYMPPYEYFTVKTKIISCCSKEELTLKKEADEASLKRRALVAPLRLLLGD